ncbi:hypothetical protein [Pseudomonas sp. R5-89-07]|uniref:hypothetical protein n=1 Tax=Pseudomonas sp. R5-89-07 TaxID=658644 RepID=UPI000F581260|nr:hypothetical protein [Pseudomonas sp. R5-89-07]AZF07417.1 hypothetical protein C4J94_4687 [Pseudomonas sp. R5-89-07]
MSERIDRDHPVKYVTQSGVTVMIGFSWSPGLDIPVGARLTLPGEEARPAYVEGDLWQSYEQAVEGAQEAAERWVKSPLR